MLLTLNLLGGLAVFLFGMKIMSDGLQKFAGPKLRQMLSIATTNKYAATFSGMLVTSVIQSSSATTVMVVGFASAGLLNLYQALGVIFGANIGTTMTAWIVSIFGFKMDIALFALPVIAIGFFAQFITKWTMLRRIGEAMVGFGLLFLGLGLMKSTIPPDIAQNPMVAEWVAKLAPTNAISLILLILTGTILTVVLQSSSAVMAMTLTFAAAGIINFPTAAALVLGENIGTTITANLAAIGANKTARRAAIGHFLFNFIGVLWVSILFHQVIALVDWIVPGNPNSTNPALLNTVLPYHISAFHTVFNVANTLIMLPLLNQLAKLTMIVIPKTNREDKGKDNDLVFLTTRFASTPELGLIAVSKEVERMMSFVTKMVDKIIHAVKTEDDKLFERLIQDIKDAEKTTDILEYKINNYLTLLTHDNLSRHAVSQTISLLDVINSVEHMGDCGEKIAKILEKFLNTNPKSFSSIDLENIEKIAKKTKEITRNVRTAIMMFPNPHRSAEAQAVFDKAVLDETELNGMRKQLREERNVRIYEGESATPESITAYADILNNFERMGDYSIRVIEDVLRMRPAVKEHSSYSAPSDAPASN